MSWLDKVLGIQDAAEYDEALNHAKALEGALDYYAQRFPAEYSDSKTWPFESTARGMVVKLKNARD